MSQVDEAARLIARLGDNASPQVIRAYHGSGAMSGE